MVDNTLLGPAFQHPLKLGADMCLYSATKYLSGFSDMIGGAATAADPALMRKMRSKRNLFGNILQPDECWMLDGRLPTVDAAHEPVEQKRGAHRRRAWPSTPRSRACSIPRCSTIPSSSASRASSAIFQAACSPSICAAASRRPSNSCAICISARNAVSLGGVETLVCHPKSTTHSGFTEEEFAQAGVTDGLVRISVGIEDWRDLLADFEQALDLI